MVGELIAGRYELEEVIGRGGMACVFRAYDRRLERRVAVKVLDERWSEDTGYVERFRWEARAAAALVHPNIVTVIDRGESDGRQYIVLEYVEGENLKQLVRDRGRLPVERALEIAIGIGQALAFAHRNGVVHRDVKPQNVLLGAECVKVSDFGIARAVGVDDSLTATGTILGTGDYLAPEQAQAQQATGLSDLYSLGALLFELLTGEPPFPGGSFLEVVMRRLHEPAPSVLERRPETPARVAAAVARALEKEPASRFTSMDAFVSELCACLAAHADTDETTLPIPLRPGRRPARRRLRVPLRALSLLALVAAGAAGVVWLRPHGHRLPAVAAAPAPHAGRVPLRAVAPYDPPPGDGIEDNQRVPLATDGNPATSWATEWYTNRRFGNLKSGVGIVLDPGRPRALETVTVHSDTPGFTALVEAGSTQSGPFHPVSKPLTCGAVTTFRLHVPAPDHYYLLWITELAPSSGGHYLTDVNEVTATGPSRAASNP